MAQIELKPGQTVKIQVMEIPQATLDKFAARFHSKREAGIPNERKSDGSPRFEDTDVQSGATEYVVANYFGKPVNDEVYERTGDDGSDLILDLGINDKVVSQGIGVIWMGYRQRGSLLTNMNDDHRYRNTDIFILVRGYVDPKTRIADFEMVGWMTKKEHWDKEKFPPKPLGSDGGDRYCTYDFDLKPMPWLIKMVNDGSALKGQ